MKQHKQILSFIAVVRKSFHDASIIYKWGACYGFYKILKQLYPKAEAYFDDKEKGHIITKIGNNYYHIDGIYPLEKDEPIKLTQNDHEYWETVGDGQRVEWIMAKYQGKCEDIKKGPKA